MANEKQGNELDEFAFEIFKTAVSHSPNRGGEQQARAAYKKAEAFLAMRERVRAGDLKAVKADGPALCEFSTPNKHRTDPHNMVSTRFGSLEQVNRVKKWLDANPTPENDHADIVERFKAQFQDLHWGNKDDEVIASINVARAIFPFYCKS